MVGKKEPVSRLQNGVQRRVVDPGVRMVEQGISSQGLESFMRERAANNVKSCRHIWKDDKELLDLALGRWLLTLMGSVSVRWCGQKSDCSGLGRVREMKNLGYWYGLILRGLAVMSRMTVFCCYFVFILKNKLNKTP